MTYYSQAWQDRFVNNLLNFKRNAYYLDIGSGPPDAQSNSCFFDLEMGWRGICVEQNSDYVELYKNKRSCKFINGDATKIDYKEVMNKLEFPSQIDFLSVDIDEGSADALATVPFDSYKFTIAIIEHDKYRLGPELQIKEQIIMKSHGYHLLFENVFAPEGCGMGPKLSFEDWWVDLSKFNVDKLSKLVVKMSSRELYPDFVIEELENMKDVFVI